MARFGSELLFSFFCVFRIGDHPHHLDIAIRHVSEIGLLAALEKVLRSLDRERRGLNSPAWPHLREGLKSLPEHQLRDLGFDPEGEGDLAGWHRWVPFDKRQHNTPVTHREDPQRF